MLKKKKTRDILSLHVGGIVAMALASFAEAYHDPCLPHQQSPRFAPTATYSQANTIEEIVSSDSGVWHIVVRGERYRICPQTYVAVVKPTGQKEKIPAEEIHNYRTEPFSLEFVQSDGVKIVTALIFHDP